MAEYHTNKTEEHPFRRCVLSYFVHVQWCLPRVKSGSTQNRWLRVSGHRVLASLRLDGSMMFFPHESNVQKLNNCLANCLAIDPIYKFPPIVRWTDAFCSLQNYCYICVCTVQLHFRPYNQIRVDFKCSNLASCGLSKWMFGMSCIFHHIFGFSLALQMW